ncbi:unnamed protein product [Ectocarpus sp. 6 AP-2014]
MSDFLKGTSVLISLPTLLYVGFAQRRNRLALLDSLGGGMSVKLENFLSLPYEFLPVFISLAYGAAAMSLRTNSTDEPESDGKLHPVWKIVLIGLSLGLSLSLAGRFGLGLPVKMFGMPPDKAHTVHLVAPVLYVAFLFYVSFLMKNLQ